MSTDYTKYYGTQVYPHINDFDFVDDLEAYDHTRVGVSLNTTTKNIPALANYPNLQTLHCFRLSEEQVRSFPILATVKNLSLSTSPIRDLSFLQQFPNLKYVAIRDCDNLESVSGITTLHEVKVLDLRGNKQLKGLAEIGNLKTLASLTITGTTAGSVLKMAGLQWITSLQALGELILKDIATPKSDLSPIAKLRHLKKLVIPVKSKLEQIAYLKGSLPNTECYYFTPFYTELNKYEELLRCVTCDSPKVRLVGKGKNRVICEQCDQELLDEHMKVFNEWQEKGQKENNY